MLGMGSRGRQSRRRSEALAAAVERWGGRSSPPRRDTVLKQYELIRAEVMTSLQLQQQILVFGITTLGLLAGAAFVGQNEVHRSDLLVVFVPLVAYLTLTIWFSEVMRMLRAGVFMLTLEKSLDDLDDGSLAWEATVARGVRAQGCATPIGSGCSPSLCSFSRSLEPRSSWDGQARRPASTSSRLSSESSL